MNQKTKSKPHSGQFSYQTWLKGLGKGPGAKAYQNFLGRVLARVKPREILTPDQWADKYRTVNHGPAKGKWKTSRSPYIKEPGEAFLDDDVETIVLMWSAQVGKSAFIANIIGSVIHQQPAPMYYVSGDDALQAMFKTTALEDMFINSPPLYKEGRVKPAMPGSNATNAHRIGFPGGPIEFTTSNSMGGLAGRTVKFMFFDEVDRYKVNKNEGDAIGIGRNRTNAFASSGRKIILTSTPTDKANSRINAAYLQGDQRRFQVACPHCGHRQFLIWSNVEWEKTPGPDGKDIHHMASAWYRCDGKGCRIEESQKEALLASGKWVATATPQAPNIRSYHLNALYSPFVPWAKVVETYFKEKSIPGGLRTFFNTQMAEVYDDPSEQADYEKLYARAETYSRHRVPRGVGFIVCSVDAQEGNAGQEGKAARLEASIVGYGRNQQKWLVDHIVIDGDYKDADTWEHLDDVRHKKYMTEDGRELSVQMTLVDSSAGNTTNFVYDYCRKRRNDRVRALKGANRQDGDPVVVKNVDVDSKGKKLPNSIKLVQPNVHLFKKWIYHSLMEITDPSAAGYIHLPEFVGIDYFKQLCNEKLVTKGTRQEYRKTGANEALDCFVYSWAAALLCRLDQKNWDDVFKNQIEEEISDELEPETVAFVEIEVLKPFTRAGIRLEIGKKLDVSEEEGSRYCTEIDPFARRVAVKTVPIAVIKAAEASKKAEQKAARRAPKNSWFG